MTNENQRALVGKVVSDRMQKTVTVLVERRVGHPVIGKKVTRSLKLHADVGEVSSLVCGDLVEIRECRRMSRTKSWRVTKVLQKVVSDFPSSLDV
jgi:small subunit ribosomal protein S17